MLLTAGRDAHHSGRSDHRDRDGRKVGDVKHIFYDEDTDRPEWLCVSTGLFGMKETFVPLQEARPVEDHVEVPYDKSLTPR